MRSILLAVLLVALQACGGGSGGSGGAGGAGGAGANDGAGGGGAGGRMGGGGSGGIGGTGGVDSTPQTPLPEEMVGTWSITTSGPSISGMSEYVFAAEGTYRQSTLIQGTSCFFSHETGTVAVEGASLTIYARTLSTSSSCDPSVAPEPAEPPAPESYGWEIVYDAEWDITYLRLDDGEGPVNWMRE